MIPSSDQKSLSLQELYQKIEYLHAYLHQHNKVDVSGECFNNEPLRLLEDLTSTQKRAIDDLYSITFIVKGQDGKPYFRVTVRQIIDKVREIVSQMSGIALQDIVLIGSAANAVLESDPSFICSIGKALDEGAPAKDISFKPLEVNDFDIRVYLKGATQEKRLEISNRLIAYYTSLAKRQYSHNLARIVAEKYLESQKNLIIRFIREKLKRSPNHLKLAEEELRKKQWKLAEETYKKFIPIIKNRVVISIIKYYRGEVQYPQTLTYLIERLSFIALTSTAFDKLNNVQKESKLLIQSFNKFEVLLIETLERECILSPDGTQVSLVSGKFVLDLKIRMQAFVDRLLRLIRCDNSIILTLDFLKCMDYQRQGFVPAKGHTARLMTVFTKKFRGEIPEIVKYVGSHLKNNALKTLVLLFNCCSELERAGYHEDRVELVSALREMIQGKFPKSWNLFLLDILNEQTLTWKEIEAIVQVVSAIYRRKNLPISAYCEVFVRNSLEEPSLTIAIRAEKTVFQCISLPWKLRESLEILIGMIFKNNKLPKCFKELYSLLIRDETDLKVVFLDFLREIEIFRDTPEHLKLWIKALQAHLGPQAVQEAERQNVFSHLERHKEVLWPHAPVTTKSQHCIKLLNEKKGAQAWEMIDDLLSSNEVEGRQLLKQIVDFLIIQEERFHEYLWNLIQIVSKLAHLTDLKTYLKLLERLILLSKVHPELITRSKTCLEHLIKEHPDALLDEAIPISKLIIQLFAECSTLPEYLVDALRRRIPQMFERIRANNDLYLFDLIQWCSRYANIMGLNLSNAKCILWAYGMRIKEGKVLGDSEKILISKIFPKIPGLVQKIDNDRNYPFWDDLKFFFSECILHEQFTLSDTLLRTFPNESATRKELVGVYLRYLKSVRKNSEKFLKLALIKELLEGLRGDLQYKECLEEFLIENAKNLDLESLSQILEINQKTSPSTWRIILLRLISSLSTRLYIDKIFNIWTQSRWDKEFWKDHLAVWTECLILSHEIESIMYRSASFFTEYVEILQSMSKTQQYTKLIFLYLKDVLARKNTPANAELAHNLRSIAGEQQNQEWIKIDTLLCGMLCVHPKYFDKVCEMLERLFLIDVSSELRSSQESSFFALYVDVMRNNVDRFQKLEEVRNKASNATHWNGFSPTIINCNSTRPEHRPLIIEQVRLLIKKIKRIHEVKIEALATIIVSFFQTDGKFEIPIEEVSKLLATKECRSCEQLTQCYLSILDRPPFKEFNDAEYINHVRRLPAMVQISDQIFCEVVKRLVNHIHKIHIPEYLDLIESYTSMVLDIIDVKQQVTLLKSPTQRLYSLHINKNDEAGDGVNFIVKLKFALLPEMEKTALAESEPYHRQMLANLILETVGPTMAYSEHEKFIHFLDSAIFMMRPSHGNCFILHSTGASTKLLNLAKHYPESIIPWRVQFFEFLVYLGTDNLLSTFNKTITCTNSEKLKCVMKAIQKISSDTDQQTFEKVILLLAVVDVIFKNPIKMDEVYELSKVLFPYLFGVAHLPISVTPANITPLDKVVIMIDGLTFPEALKFDEADKEHHFIMLDYCFKLCSSHDLRHRGELLLKKVIVFLCTVLPKLYDQYSPEFTEYLFKWFPLIIEAVKKENHNIEERLIFDLIISSVAFKSDAEKRRRARFLIYFLQCLISNEDDRCFIYAGGISGIALIEKVFFNQELFDVASKIFKEKSLDFVTFNPKEP